MSALRIGVLGLGRIGAMHAELLQRRVEGVEVAAIFDPDAARARAAAARLDAPVARSAAALIGARSLDAVAICTPTAGHAELVVAAARAGRAIFCEKPVALDLAGVDRALAAVAECGVPFQIGFNRRFDPGHASVRRAVLDGTIGAPHLVRISSRDPAPPSLAYVRDSGGLFLDMTIHDFDMARFVCGSDVVSVSAQAARRIRPEYAEAGDVDTAVVTLEHADGCLTAIDNSRHAAYGYDQRVEVHGSLGMASSESPPLHSGLVRTAAGTRTPPLPERWADRYAASFLAQWTAFAGALREGTEPPVGPADARAPLVLGLAALRSLREHRPVAVAEPPTVAA